MKKISNITVSEFKRFLKHKGCNYSHTSSGHEIWECPGCLRPIVFQTHISPIPVFVILNNLRTMNVSKKEFLSFFEKKKK